MKRLALLPLFCIMAVCAFAQPTSSTAPSYYAVKPAPSMANVSDSDMDDSGGNELSKTRFPDESMKKMVVLSESSTSSFEHDWFPDGAQGKGQPQAKKQTEPLAGKGTQEDPFQISTLVQLQELDPLFRQGYYRLMNDLDATATRTWNNGQGFEPIGIDPGCGCNRSCPLPTFYFDGNGKVIRNLYINRPYDESVGLFSSIDAEGQISHLGLEDVEITGKNQVGALSGIFSSVQIKQCYATGKVSGSDKVGGLSGTATCTTVTQCAFVGEVSASQGTAGGLFAELRAAGISNDFRDVEGLSAILPEVSQCYTNAHVTGISGANGFVGYANISISDCNEFLISDCYAVGDVSGYCRTSPFCDKNIGTMRNCYSAGGVQRESYSPNTFSISEEKNSGFKRKIPTVCFWNADFCGLSFEEKALGNWVSAEKLRNRETFKGWDFENVWQISPDKNNGMPTLRTMPEIAAPKIGVAKDPASPKVVSYKYADFAGDGTAEKPYLLTKVEHLLRLSEEISAGRTEGKFYKLANDLNLAVLEAQKDGGDYFPLGRNLSGIVAAFQGDFDGNGKALGNLKISSQGLHAALFGIVGEKGRVHHLLLPNVNISYMGLDYDERASFVAGVAGENYGLVENCLVSGKIQSKKVAAGIVSQNQGTIRGCCFDGTILGPFGGGIAVEHSGTMEFCTAKGRISGMVSGGGLICSMKQGTVRECAAENNVESRYRESGGLIGRIEINDKVEVENCYASGEVQGMKAGGGLIGALSFDSDVKADAVRKSRIFGCYAVGKIGLLQSRGLMSPGPQNSDKEQLGGLIIPQKRKSHERDESPNLDDLIKSVSSCYWDTQTVDTSVSLAGTGKTTPEMKKRESFDGWDFDKVWMMDPARNNGYPALRNAPGEAAVQALAKAEEAVKAAPATEVIAAVKLPFAPEEAPGKGTEAEPYLISKMEHLMWLREQVNQGQTDGKFYRMVADIDASMTAEWDNGSGMLPIGGESSKPNIQPLPGMEYIEEITMMMQNRMYVPTSFDGVFDGNGKTLRGLVINRPYRPRTGLFGVVDVKGVVKNLTLDGVSVTGENSTGGLAGENAGRLEGCQVSGTICGKYNVGSITGLNNSKPCPTGVEAIQNAYRIPMMLGLMGTPLCTTQATPTRKSLVVHCKSSGTVKGESSTGGLVGVNSDDSRVENSSSSSRVVGFSGMSIGGLVGENSGNITDCHAEGNVTGGSSLGGLVGSNLGTIEYCFATGNVAFQGDGRMSHGLGGLVGSHSVQQPNMGKKPSANGLIQYCHATGKVSGILEVGGLVGRCDLPLKCSYSTGDVSGNGFVGGLAGYVTALISDCYATGQVSCDAAYGGGLAGNLKITLKNSQMRQALADPDNYKFPTVLERCYSLSKVRGNVCLDALLSFREMQKAIPCTVVGCLWDKEATDNTGSVVNQGCTTAEMKNQASYQDWDFENVWTMDPAVNNGYPTLRPPDRSGKAPVSKNTSKPKGTKDAVSDTSETAPAITAEAPAGKGTEAEPYEIAKLEHLVWIGVQIKDGKTRGTFYRMTSDIDAAPAAGQDDGAGWLPLGWRDLNRRGIFPSNNSGFQGVFDGNGKTIRGLVIHRPKSAYIGLFSDTDTSSVIKNLSVENATVQGGYDVGGIVGTCRGLIENCRFSGSVTGTRTTGGMVGSVGPFGPFVPFDPFGPDSPKTAVLNMRGCESSGKVAGVNSVGGLIGEMETYCQVIDCRSSSEINYTDGDMISNFGGLVGNIGFKSILRRCSASGNVSGEGKIGGLVGSNRGIVDTCFATGSVTGGISNYSRSIGGLVGSHGEMIVIKPENRHSVVVRDSYATGAVSGGASENVGGLIGSAGGLVERSYSTGAVSGKSPIGGLIGTTTAPVRDCYSLGAVNCKINANCVGGLIGIIRLNSEETPEIPKIERCYTMSKVSAQIASQAAPIMNFNRDQQDLRDKVIVSCVWNSETPGVPPTNGATPKTLEEMKTPAAYPGWDFEKVWELNPAVNQGLPTLRTISK